MRYKVKTSIKIEFPVYAKNDKEAEAEAFNVLMNIGVYLTKNSAIDTFVPGKLKIKKLEF